MKPESLDAAIAATASKTTYAGAGAAAFGWIFSSEFGALVGIALAIAGFAVNLYFKVREDRRQQQRHEAKMRTPTECR